METKEQNSNLISQVATILNFVIALIQLVIIIITIGHYNAQQKYAERQYIILEKMIEKSNNLLSTHEQLLIKEQHLTEKLESYFRLTASTNQ